MSFLSLSLSPLSTNLLLLSVHVRPLVAADAVGGARRHARPGGRLKRYLGKSMANSLPSSRLHHTKGLTTTSCNRPRTPLPTWQSKCSRAWSRRWLELCVRKKCVSNGVLLERQNKAIIIISLPTHFKCQRLLRSLKMMMMMMMMAIFCLSKRTPLLTHFLLAHSSNQRRDQALENFDCQVGGAKPPPPVHHRHRR